MAIETAPDRIRVNAICPGPGHADALDVRRRRFAAHKASTCRRSARPPLRRTTLQGTMVFPSSDEASFITGAVIEVDGGRCI